MTKFILRKKNYAASKYADYKVILRERYAASELR